MYNFIGLYERTVNEKWNFKYNLIKILNINQKNNHYKSNAWVESTMS